MFSGRRVSGSDAATRPHELRTKKLQLDFGQWELMKRIGGDDSRPVGNAVTCEELGPR